MKKEAEDSRIGTSFKNSSFIHSNLDDFYERKVLFFEKKFSLEHRAKIGFLPVIAKIPSKTLSDEFDKLSIATTSNPSLCNSTTVCEPINPNPPVTTIFIFLR